MLYQVPVDLIERARILLRNEADLECYNPSDPSFPILPSVEAVIAGFDPSPDCPRCEHCRGKLLRGSQSLICFYCGREPKRDCPPEPLSFKSTIGFQWLVDSLGLDGSEIIEASEEGKQSNKGWKSVKDEMSLSEFLSKEMKWAVESERFGLCVADDLRNHEKGVLRLAGIDFHHSLSEELPIVEAISNSKSIDVKPTKGKVGDTFSSWEADFQAASSVAPLPHDDESDQKDFEEGKSIHDSSHVPPTVEDIETDYRSNIFSGVSSSTKLPGNDDSSDPCTGSGDNKHLTSTINAHKESAWFETWSDFRSSGLDSAKEMFVSAGNELFGPWNDVPNLKCSEQGQEEVPDKLAVSVDNLQQTGTLLTADQTSEKDVWDDFMGSSVSQHNLGDSGSVEFVGGWLNDEGGDTTDRWGYFMSLSSPQREKETNSTETRDGIEIIKDDTLSSLTSSATRPESKSGNEDMTQACNDISRAEVPKTDTAKDEDVFNSWGDFSSTCVLQSTQQQNNEALSEGHMLFNDWSSRTKGTSEHQLKVDEDSVPAAISEIDDSFDAWSEFTSSTALPKESQVDGKQDTAGNDPFDAWSLLITSSSQISNQNVTSIEPANETSLFDSSRNQKVAEFDSSLQPFLFPDAANGSASTGISSSQVLDHFSTSQNDEPQASGQMSWKKPIDVEALMSQMHDLSFMLENDLSVSKNVD